MDRPGYDRRSWHRQRKAPQPARIKGVSGRSIWPEGSQYTHFPAGVKRPGQVNEQIHPQDEKEFYQVFDYFEEIELWLEMSLRLKFIRSFRALSG
jgi:hypothetical protein